jgi:hypothetical protein
MIESHKKNKIHFHDGHISVKRMAHLITIIVIPVLIIGLIAWYFLAFDEKKEKNNNTSVSTSTTIYNETDSWVKITDSEYGFEIRYLDDIFTKESYMANFQPYLSAELTGTKLISKFRVDLIGNQQCFYGQSGIGVVCKVSQEGGIAIVPMSRENLDVIVSDISKTLVPKEKEIAGKKTYLFEMSVEGEGEDSYYIEINETQGLMISRVYVDTFKPDAVLFQKMLDTLKFTK